MITDDGKESGEFSTNVNVLEGNIKVQDSLQHEMDIDDSKLDRIETLSAADPTASSNPIKFDKTAARKVFLKSLDGKINF